MATEDLIFAGVIRQSQALRAGQVTPRELTKCYLERIERLNRRLNCYRVVLADQAREEADHAAERLAAGDPAPLLGIPVAVKDSFDVAGEVTTHGTGAASEPARDDCELVRRLRRAGAVLLGKTTMPELAMWAHFTESQTWGVTRNPWNLDRSPGGSSGGSAVAVAAGLAAAAIGTDGGASTRVPAAACGLVGVKPQRGRISLMPLAEHWYGLTVAGVLAWSVADAAVVLDALAGPAPGDATAPPPPDQPFVQAASAPPGRLRIAVSVRPVLPTLVGASAKQAAARTAALLGALGHQVTRVRPRYGLPLLPGMVRYLKGVATEAATLQHRDRLEPRTRAMVGLGERLSGARLEWALANERVVRVRIDPLFARYDVLLTPVMAAPPPPVGRWRRRGAARTFLEMTPWITYTAFWNLTGQPAVAVPAGRDAHGLPMAVQLVGRANDEATLLRLAAQLEAERPWADQRPPLARQAFA